MMTSLAQNFQPGGIQQHPGVPPGHPMAGPHNPQQMQGGMPPQMHMGVSGPGPQVSQGAMMGGMPPGVGGPSAHAMQHLNPNQQAQFMQQQAMCKSTLVFKSGDHHVKSATSNANILLFQSRTTHSSSSINSNRFNSR